MIMEGHLVRLARRARGEPVGFAPTYTGPPPLQPGITDELLADAQPAEQNAFSVRSNGSSVTTHVPSWSRAFWMTHPPP